MYKKVMVIDDTYEDRYVVKRINQKYPFSEDLILMESAADALDYLLSKADASEELPDIIFLDIRMPEIDGFGFLERFERMPDTVKKKMIIIMLTSSLSPEDHKKAMNNKYVHQFINKPFTIEEVNKISL